MSLLFTIFVVLFIAGAALGIYAILAPKKERVAQVPPAGPDPVEIAHVTDAIQDGADWTQQAGSEFAGLNEAARCEFIFAVAAIDDDRSRRLLMHALDDPSATVALAAAHALARAGRIEDVRAYAESHAGPRSDELMQLLSLLA